MSDDDSKAGWTEELAGLIPATAIAFMAQIYLSLLPIMSSTLSELKLVEASLQHKIAQAERDLSQLRGESIFVAGRVRQQEEIDTTIEEESTTEASNAE